MTMRWTVLARLGLAVLLLFPPALLAETVQGRIMEISRLANTIQINVPNQDPVVIRFDGNTRFVEAQGIGDLSGNDLIEVEFTPGSPATQIRKVVFGLPPGIEIDIREMLSILTGDEPYTLIDTRPRGPFLSGTIPSSINSFTRVDEADFIATLPEDKDRLLVFYCGGSTCPYTGEAVGMAQKAGYTNIKGYQGGIPDWRRAQLPLHADPNWVADRLNPGHVIIDTRNPVVSAMGHLPGAVAMPSANFEALTERFLREDREPMLPRVSDRRAPIILYSDQHFSDDVLIAFRELASWGYRNISILRDGFAGWQEAGLPVERDQVAFAINFVRTLPPGAIAPEEFAAMDLARDDLIILDVRSDQEVTEGMIANAIHIPLEKVEENLERLDKTKEIIAVCATGIRAEMVYRLLNSAGYKVRFLNEHIEVADDGSVRVL